MDSIDFTSQDSLEGDSHSDSVENFRRDVRALLQNRRIPLEKLRQIGTKHLFRDGFQAESCTSVESAGDHIMRIYEEAGRRRGKIRRIICLAIAGKLDDRKPMNEW
jgi:hypothetical protein